VLQRIQSKLQCVALCCIVLLCLTVTLCFSVSQCVYLGVTKIVVDIDDESYWGWGIT